MEKTTICAISDIHGSLIDIPKCDILCICGDILPTDIQRNFVESIAWLAGPFQHWLLNAPCKHVVMIWGNHDFIGERLYKYGTKEIPTKKFISAYGFTGYEQHEALFQEDENDKITILCDDYCVIEGLKIYGTSWCPSLENWAFYGNEKTLNAKFDKIPTDIDILLTHCPPKFGQQGIVLQQCWNFCKDFGCQELQNAIRDKFNESIKPVYVLSGHIHSGNHDWENMGNVKYRNVSVKDENYYIDYSPLIFTIDILQNY